MHRFLLFITLLTVCCCWSQEDINNEPNYDDPKYREDQFYVGVTYNLLGGKPSGVSQQGLSGGFNLGFIRDLPINEKRTVGFGIGIGYSNDSYNQNLLIAEDNNGVATYSVLNTDDDSYSKNKLNMHAVELPIQFRWRNSTIESHKFWRIYAGVKLGYIFSSVAKHNGEVGSFKNRNPEDLNKFQTTADLGFGYNTWNFYFSYGVNKLFSNDAKIDGSSINMRAIKFGLIFYIF